jgi:hypothetical protein
VEDRWDVRRRPQVCIQELAAGPGQHARPLCGPVPEHSLEIARIQPLDPSGDQDHAIRFAEAAERVERGRIDTQQGQRPAAILLRGLRVLPLPPAQRPDHVASQPRGAAVRVAERVRAPDAIGQCLARQALGAPSVA